MSGISIIVPTRDRAGLLLQTLRSIASVVDASRESVEIIVVDNGSIDDTADVCREIKNHFPKQNWRYFYDETPGLLTGRHLGAREAQTDILAYLDDDVLLTPSWLEALNDAFDDPEVMLTGGPTWPHYEVKPPSWLAGMWEEYQEGVRVLGELSLVDLGPNRKEVSPLYVPGANFAIRKAALQACGGFHPDCLPKPLQRYQGNGETGLALKMRVRGLKALYHPGAAVKHVIPASRLTPESFEQKGFYQGVGGSYSNIRPKWTLAGPDQIVERPTTTDKMEARAQKALAQPHARKYPLSDRPCSICWALVPRERSAQGSKNTTMGPKTGLLRL